MKGIIGYIVTVVMYIDRRKASRGCDFLCSTGLPSRENERYNCFNTCAMFDCRKYGRATISHDVRVSPHDFQRRTHIGRQVDLLIGCTLREDKDASSSANRTLEQGMI
jgi:hypothetical protein